MKYFFWILFIAVLFVAAMAAGFWNVNPGQPEHAAFSQVVDSQLFTLPDLQGKEISLASALKENKAVLLSFWTTWCPYCGKEVPALNEIQKKFANGSFTVIGVNVGESKEKVVRYAEKMSLVYPIALDEDSRAAESFHVLGIPTNYLIAADGKVLGEYQGVTDDLASDIQKALAG